MLIHVSLAARVGKSRVKRDQVHLGAWTIFCDIAGHVSENPDNPIVTVAAVAVPPERIGHVRKRLLRAFDQTPMKWKKGGLDGWSSVAHVITRFDLPVAVSQLHRSGEAWTRFFAQARTCLEAAGERLVNKSAFTPDNVVRMLLLSRGFSGLTGRLIRSRYPWGALPATIDIEEVADSDLKGPEAEELFKTSIAQWPDNSRLRGEFNVVPTARARIATDDDEPLLLLPDYVAGLYHHADPRTRLFLPVVLPTDAEQAVLNFQTRMGKKLHELPGDFDESYPLDHDDLGKVRVRD